MLAHCGSAHPKRGSELAGPARPSSQHLDHPAPGRVGQRSECVIEGEAGYGRVRHTSLNLSSALWGEMVKQQLKY